MSEGSAFADRLINDGKALTAFPRVRSSETFGRRPLIPGRPLAPGRHPKPFTIPAIRGTALEPRDSTLLGHSAFAPGIGLLPHLEGLFQRMVRRLNIDAMVKEI